MKPLHGRSGMGGEPAAARWFVPITVVFYAAILAVTVSLHEPWRDEADSWLAARDLSFFGILRFSRYVGTPALWNLILFPFAKAGAPYESMGWIHAAIAVTAAAVFLALAPLPKIARVLVVFSYYLAYEYAVIARNYALLALMLFVTAALYARRRDRPMALAIAIFFLFNTSAHGAFFAALISGLLAWEWLRHRPIERSHVAALAIMLAGAITAGAQLWPPADSQRPEFFELRMPVGALIDVLTRAIALPLGSPMLEPLWLIVNLIAIGVATAYLARRPSVVVLWLGGLLSLAYIFAFKWVMPERHAGIVLLWLLFALWIADAQEEADDADVSAAPGRVRLRHVTIALSIALLPACVRTAIAAYDELRYEYSCARQMGQFLVAHDLDRGRPIAATNLAESVLPYLRVRQVWNVHTRRWQSHQLWDRAYHANWFILGPELWKRVEENFPADARPCILSDFPLPYVTEHGYRLIYHTQGPVPPATRETFYFYAPLDDTR